MASPISLTTAPVTILNANRRRVIAQLQNAGTIPIYVIKQHMHRPVRIPSPTNYDFILKSSTDDNNIEQVRSIAAFSAVSTGPALVAVMETIEV